jgi:hypothetical protein
MVAPFLLAPLPVTPLPGSPTPASYVAVDGDGLERPALPAVRLDVPRLTSARVPSRRVSDSRAAGVALLRHVPVQVLLPFPVQNRCHGDDVRRRTDRDGEGDDVWPVRVCGHLPGALLEDHRGITGG